MKFLLCSFGIFFFLENYSQGLITAKIVDSYSDQSLSGISISLNSGDTTTTTNKSGYFQLYAEKGDTLIISGEGYETSQLFVPTVSSFLIKIDPYKSEPVSNRFEKGQQRDGYKVGVWHYYDYGEKVLSIDYDNSSLVYLKKDTAKYAVQIDAEWKYVSLDQQPRFLGSMNQFKNTLLSNIIYPRQAQRMGIEGTTFLMFEIDTAGQVSNVQLINDIGAECGQAVLVGFNEIPALWIPAKLDGRALKARFHISTSFQFSNKKHANWTQRKQIMEDYPSIEIAEVIVQAFGNLKNEFKSGKTRKRNGN